MENRKVTRVPFHERAVISCGGVVIEGEVADLSLNGMYMKTGVTIEPNTQVDVTIHLSGTTSNLTISLKGTVMRRDKKGMAVQFVEVGIDSFIHLKNIVLYAHQKIDTYRQYESDE